MDSDIYVHIHGRSALLSTSMLMHACVRAHTHTHIHVYIHADLIEFTDRLADMGKIVILSALDGTYQRKEFGDVLKLIPRAESVTKLSSVCKICYRCVPKTPNLGD